MPGSYYSDVERTIYLTYVILVEDIAKYDELFQQERKFLSFEYWSAHVSQIDYDDLVYGLDRLSEIVSKQPDAKDGLVRFLYEIILRRMEVRDRSRSVNSIDVIFNFDCIGFTGTPFIDNYPTFVSGPRLRLAAGAMGPSPTGPSRIGVPALPARGRDPRHDRPQLLRLLERGARRGPRKGDLGKGPLAQERCDLLRHFRRRASRLYRRRFRPPKNHFSRFFEIGKIYTFLHLWTRSGKKNWKPPRGPTENTEMAILHRSKLKMLRNLFLFFLVSLGKITKNHINLIKFG